LAISTKVSREREPGIQIGGCGCWVVRGHGLT
jgi:hypothetical protein